MAALSWGLVGKLKCDYLIIKEELKIQSFINISIVALTYAVVVTSAMADLLLRCTVTIARRSRSGAPDP